jgi:hypothetical protein
MRSLTTALLFTLVSLAVSQNPHSADGSIVPFSVLPACASNCGLLYDVQGTCSPPIVSAVNSTCFCTDPRLRPFDDAGTTGVSEVCGGVGSCTVAADLQAIKSWYDSYCAGSTTTLSTTSSGLAPSKTPSVSTSSLLLSYFNSSTASRASTSTSLSASPSATPVPVNHGTLNAEAKAGIGIGTVIGGFLLALLG